MKRAFSIRIAFNQSTHTHSQRTAPATDIALSFRMEHAKSERRRRRQNAHIRYSFKHMACLLWAKSKWYLWNSLKCKRIWCTLSNIQLLTITDIGCCWPPPLSLSRSLSSCRLASLLPFFLQTIRDSCSIHSSITICFSFSFGQPTVDGICSRPPTTSSEEMFNIWNEFPLFHPSSQKWLVQRFCKCNTSSGYLDRHAMCHSIDFLCLCVKLKSGECGKLKNVALFGVVASRSNEWGEKNGNEEYQTWTMSDFT